MDGSSEHLNVSRSAGDAEVVHVTGELDAYSAPMLEKELARQDGPGDLRLDLSGVTFIDSTGLRVVIAADNRLRDSEHRMVVVEPSPSVLRLLQLTALDQQFVIESST